MKIWIHIFLVFVFIFFAGCADETKSSFVTFVYPDYTIAKDILVKKVDCMHCPTYFRFTTDSSGKKAILDYQGMHKMHRPPTDMEKVLYLPKAGWWPSTSEIDTMEKFWAEYPGTGSSEGSFFRMALIKGNTVYFMAKGGNWIRDKGQ